MLISRFSLYFKHKAVGISKLLIMRVYFTVGSVMSNLIEITPELHPG